MKQPSIRMMVLNLVVALVVGQVASEIGQYIHGLTRAQHALVVGGIAGLFYFAIVLISWKWTLGKWIVRKK